MKISRSAILSIEGCDVVCVHRAFYEFKGDVDRSRGPLQLTLSDSRILVCTGESDGARLRIEWEPWVDSFAEPLSAENRAWVAEHGKHVLQDVSDDPVVGPVTGVTLTSVRPVFLDGVIAGLIFRASKEAFLFLVAGAEDYVMALDDPRVKDWGAVIVDEWPS